MHRTSTGNRKGERGVTMLLVVFGMFAILAMAALSIDVMTLYAAHTDAQRVADGAALAGARMFVQSGFTSWQLGDPTSGATQSQVCASGSPGSALANTTASGVAGQNMIAGQIAALTNVTCNFSGPNNPRITVTTGRTDLPTFFGRIFGQRTVSVSATATAEAFNPSGSTVAVSVGSVKPWLIPNCDPGSVPPSGGPCGDFFLDSTNNYTPRNPSSYIGLEYTFSQRTEGPGVGPGMSQYYAVDMSTQQATVCPSSAATGCSSVGGGGGTAGYLDNIACANTNRLTCGSPASSLQLDDKNGKPPMIADTVSGTQCLIHNDVVGPSPEQDSFATAGSGNPVVITGGSSNPNTAFRGTPNISRSDSVVTVPVFQWSGEPCTGPAGKCQSTQTVVGFLQLGVEDVSATGDIHAIVLNAVGCNPAASGTPVSGGGVSTLPVRLVQ